jgi:hypothetical protein
VANKQWVKVFSFMGWFSGLYFAGGLWYYFYFSPSNGCQQWLFWKAMDVSIKQLFLNLFISYLKAHAKLLWNFKSQHEGCQKLRRKLEDDACFSIVKFVVLCRE